MGCSCTWLVMVDSAQVAEMVALTVATRPHHIMEIVTLQLTMDQDFHRFRRYESALRFNLYVAQLFSAVSFY